MLTMPYCFNDLVEHKTKGVGRVLSCTPGMVIALGETEPILGLIEDFTPYCPDAGCAYHLVTGEGEALSWECTKPRGDVCPSEGA